MKGRILYDPSSAGYSAEHHPEHPFRTRDVAAHLGSVFGAEDVAWSTPEPASEECLQLAHVQEHINEVQSERVHDFDADTPAIPGIYQHAVLAVGAAVEAGTRAVKDGEKVFCLMRPPGHHATKTRAMGFCYFNNVAISALHALKCGVERVGVWDFDVHHGNGTEDILAGRKGVEFSSVHQFPGYPGTGRDSFANITNRSVPPRVSRHEQMRVIRESLDVLFESRIELLLVSAGFDAYARDPLGQTTLEIEDFRTIGSWLAGSGVPCAAVLEGGYSRDLPQLVEAFLRGWFFENV